VDTKKKKKEKEASNTSDALEELLRGFVPPSLDDLPNIEVTKRGTDDIQQINQQK
jgi:hypothetical protein